METEKGYEAALASPLIGCGVTVASLLLLLTAVAKGNPCPCDTAKPNGVHFDNIRVHASAWDQTEPSIAVNAEGFGLLMIGANTLIRPECENNGDSVGQGNYIATRAAAAGITWGGGGGQTA